VNVRVMAATHRDLSRAIQEGAFREDLYYRLNVIRIVIPPLRKRQDEILALAEALLARHLPMGHRAPVFSDELKRFLVEYRWPGNVRELENVMRRFIVYQDCGMLIQELVDGEADIRLEAGLDRTTRFPVTDSAAGLTPQKTEEAGGKADRLDQLAEASRTAEIEFLLDALEACRWNRRQAAASLNIEYKAFLYKLQKYGIVESKVKRRAFTA
jgi:DNA-binding NtrC family response regulator